MPLQARFEDLDEAERRNDNRRSLRLGTSAGVADANSLAVTVHDLSESGILLETRETLAIRQCFQVVLPHVGPMPAIVVWNSGDFYGCQFVHSVPRAALSAALLKGEARPADEGGLLFQDGAISPDSEAEPYLLSGEHPSRDFYENDATEWVVLACLVLAALAGLVLIAALLGSPLAS
jgi:hypothetical protein